MGFGDLGQPQRRKIGVAKLQQFWPEREISAIYPHVAEVDERVEKAPGGCSIKAGQLGHLAQRQRWMIGVEGHDHRETPLEALHERLARTIGLVLRGDIRQIGLFGQ